MHRTARWTVPGLALALLFPALLDAQTGARRVDGFVAGGLATAVRDLGVITLTSGAEARQFTNKVGIGPQVEGGLVVPVGGGRASVRASASWSSQDIETIDAICEDGFVPCSEVVPVESSASLLGLTAALILHGGDTGGVVRPYFLVGGSLRAYRFEAASCGSDSVACEAASAFLDDQLRPALKVGLGTFVGSGPIQLHLEAGAHVGQYQTSDGRGRGETQNDLAFSAGLTFPLLSR